MHCPRKSAVLVVTVVVLHVYTCGVGAFARAGQGSIRALQGHMHAWQLVCSLQIQGICM